MSEYYYLKGIFTYIFVTWRFSMGDFSMNSSIPYLDEKTSQAFWILWSISVFLLFIIFLNYVVTEACSSYDKVDEHICHRRFYIFN